MTFKQFPALAAVYLAGFVTAYFVFSDTPSTTNAADGAVVAGDANSVVAALRADYERQIADYKMQLEATRTQQPGAGGVSSLEPSAVGVAKLMSAACGADYAAARERETSRLVAAGFTLDRIEQIRKRADELMAEFKQKQDRGKVGRDEQVAHYYDSDIDLRAELGDEEYARYRKALGRYVGMKLADVFEGGSGESAGLRAGDEITAYNGVRIFNVGELNPQIAKYANSGQSMTVDLMRDGQRVRLVVPAGDLRLRPLLPVATVEDMLRFQSH